MENTFHFHLRSQVLSSDDGGHNCWAVNLQERVIPAGKTAVLLCDIWDNHWSRGAVDRLTEMLPRMNEVVALARQKGAKIIHAPSETLEFYTDSPARARMLAIPKIKPPRNRRILKPRLPIDDRDGGSDTGEKSWYKAWARQHPAITIDEEQDVISDDGQEIFSFLHDQGIEFLVILGVHTNMCILNRSFGIMQMVRWGVPVALVRDLTDTMYNPAKAPYVSHAEGTQLVIEYIEKFWCPTILSSELI
ncbi:MAG: isochorismatase family protein [Anaerolineaceae bacterium]|nr:isochorismatase family protein [Anaerolineaceae bacterium]